MSCGMDWNKLLSHKRLGKPKAEESLDRSYFQRDFDRIVFSSAFRRLQDKTQVYPLAESDYVRTRLTHSLEVSCVGRSLGSIVGKRIIERHQLHNIDYSEFGSIVASACLAHDIGNPPLGHSGEEAIQNWFMDSDIGKEIINDLTVTQREDFLKFEGNAQGFRVLSRLQSPDNTGGMQLTCATLAAFTKYPRESFVEGRIEDLKRKSAKKFGFFQDDKQLFSEVADEVGLLKIHNDHAWWCRHPLAFLVEAADDITYTIIDFEDGYRLGHISFQEVSDILIELLKGENLESYQTIQADKEKIEYLRAKSINKLIFEVCNVFWEQEDLILLGKYDKALTKDIPSAANLDRIVSISKKKAYCARNVLEIEAAGFQVLGELIRYFITSVNDVAKNAERALPRSKKLIELIPEQYLGDDRKPDNDQYSRLIKITDFVSGMTDTFAVSLYKKLSGISLPRG